MIIFNLKQLGLSNMLSVCWLFSVSSSSSSSASSSSSCKEIAGQCSFKLVSILNYLSKTVKIALLYVCNNNSNLLDMFEIEIISVKYGHMDHLGICYAYTFSTSVFSTTFGEINLWYISNTWYENFINFTNSFA